MATQIDLSRSKTPWSWSIKIRRGVWTYLMEPMVRWLPKACSPLRVALLRLMGARIAAHCLVMPGVRVLMPWNLRMGEWTSLGEGVNVYNFATVSLGSQTVVSQFSFLCTGSHDYNQSHMPLTVAPIAIGSQAWVAAGCFVAPGVTIAEGVVVGAMSVVTRSLDEPWSVWAGNPCRRIKARGRPSATAEGAAR